MQQWEGKKQPVGNGRVEMGQWKSNHLAMEEQKSMEEQQKLAMEVGRVELRFPLYKKLANWQLKSRQRGR